VREEENRHADASPRHRRSLHGPLHEADRKNTFSRRDRPGALMLDRVRERILGRGIRGGEVPSCIAVVISAEAVGAQWWRKVGTVAGWCTTLGIREAALFSEFFGPEEVEDLERE